MNTTDKPSGPIAGEEVSTPKPPQRAELQYFGLNKRAPPGYLNMDAALDQVGARLFPILWGIHPDFDKLPILGGNAVQSVELTSEKALDTELFPIELDEERSKPLRDAFKETHDWLYERVYHAEIEAVALVDGEFRPIAKGLYAQKWRTIFLVGRIRIKGKRRLQRVIINETQLVEALNRYDKGPSRNPSSADISRCAEAINNALTSLQADGPVIVIKNPLKEVIATFLAERGKANNQSISDQIWGRLHSQFKLKAGAPSKNQRKQFAEGIAPVLEKALNAVLPKAVVAVDPKTGQSG